MRTQPLHARWIARVLLALVVAGGTAGVAGTPAMESGAMTTPAEPVREQFTIAAPSLDGNLLGDPSEVHVEVETPASYATEPDRRFPVVYFLTGYDEGAAVGTIGRELERLVADGRAPEMILVAVSGDNALGGSFYVDSPVTGDWERAVVEDVVGAIDHQYRTLATLASRGIAGFSMGGYGALRLAFHHPDVFGAVYALSPGLFAPDGLAKSQMFAEPEVVADFLAGQAELAALSPEEAAGEVVGAMARSGDARFATAYGAAFAPDSDAHPPWIRYPYTALGGPVDEEVWAQWQAGFGGLAEEAGEIAAQARQLRGIVIDVGVHDDYTWIPSGCEYLHEQLDQAGVPHRIERFEGGHGPVGPRAAEVMLPFFAEVLDAA